MSGGLSVGRARGSVGFTGSSPILHPLLLSEPFIWSGVRSWGQWFRQEPHNETKRDSLVVISWRRNKATQERPKKPKIPKPKEIERVNQSESKHNQSYLSSVSSQNPQNQLSKIERYAAKAKKKHFRIRPRSTDKFVNPLPPTNSRDRPVTYGKSSESKGNILKNCVIQST